jgi:hypothetical protein
MFLVGEMMQKPTVFIPNGISRSSRTSDVPAANNLPVVVRSRKIATSSNPSITLGAGGESPWKAKFH